MESPQLGKGSPSSPTTARFQNSSTRTMFGIGVAFGAGIWVEAGFVSCVGLKIAVALGDIVAARKRVGVGAIVTDAAAGDELVGIRVGLTEGMVGTSLPWHPATINATAITNGSQRYIS